MPCIRKGLYLSGERGGNRSDGVCLPGSAVVCTTQFRFAAYFLLSLMAATLKLRLPGLTGTLSIGFVFVLLGISELTLAETMLMACAGVAVQCLWRAQRRPAAVQVLFSVSAVAVSLTLAFEGAQFVRTTGHAGAGFYRAGGGCVYLLWPTHCWYRACCRW